MTLHQLRDLLTRAHGPAVERHPTADALLRAFMPTKLRARVGLLGIMDEMPQLNLLLELERPDAPLDLTDPGTVNAVKVALALALGLDPGPMGCAASWRRVGTCFAQEGWSLATAGACRWFISDEAQDADEACAPAVAAEPDAVKALVLAVEHVLATR